MPLPVSWWTDERVDELKARWERGETGTEICLAMHAASRNAVVGKVHRLHLPRPSGLFKHSNGVKVRPSPIFRPTIRKATKAGKEEMAEEPAPVFAQPKKLMQLKAGDCRWPGAGRGTDMLYCAAPKVDGFSYCLAHCRIAYAGAPRVKVSGQ